MFYFILITEKNKLFFHN